MKETVKIACRAMVFVSALLFMFGVDFVRETLPRVGFVKEAEAIVGAPFTPGSVAGVARRTTRRVVATEAEVATATAATAAATQSAAAAAPKPAAPPPPAPQPAAQAAGVVPIGTVVQALPGGCTSIVVGGVDYSDCGGAFYKAAFQGNNLVYVVVEKPFK
jgi:hypothetical protein